MDRGTGHVDQQCHAQSPSSCCPGNHENLDCCFILDWGHRAVVSGGSPTQASLPHSVHSSEPPMCHLLPHLEQRIEASGDSWNCGAGCCSESSAGCSSTYPPVLPSARDGPAWPLLPSGSVGLSVSTVRLSPGSRSRTNSTCSSRVESTNPGLSPCIQG